MKRLSKKARLQKAIEEAEAHVREWGTADLEDWAFTYAFQWGFEDDQAVIESITQAMKATVETIRTEREEKRKEQEEPAYQKWKQERLRRRELEKEVHKCGMWRGVKPFTRLRSEREKRFEERLKAEEEPQNKN